MTDIKIAEFILLVGNEGAKVAAHKAVPESLILLCVRKIDRVIESDREGEREREREREREGERERQREREREKVCQCKSVRVIEERMRASCVCVAY